MLVELAACVRNWCKWAADIILILIGGGVKADVTFHIARLVQGKGKINNNRSFVQYRKYVIYFKIKYLPSAAL